MLLYVQKRCNASSKQALLTNLGLNDKDCDNSMNMGRPPAASISSGVAYKEYPLPIIKLKETY